MSMGMDEYVLSVSEMMLSRTGGARPLAFVKTYGCQQNVADAEKIKGILETMGFDFSENADDADFILFNTCAVREHAQDRVFGNIGALKNIKRRRPNVIIGVCGCMAEQEHVAQRIKKSFPFVNIVFGPHVIHKLPKMLYDMLVNSVRLFISGGEESRIIEGLPVRRDGSFKAWVTVMYGCDNFCSYCVVPFVRGREKSRSSDKIIDEFEQLVKAGYKDITLLGQNVNSYGKGLDEDINFAKLLRRLDETPGDYVIRFMTSHPKDASRELFDTIAQSKHISHHIHLPFQSGNDRVLSLMNRKYTRAQYLELIEYARSVISDVNFTSDVIVGFPGETYAEFKDTLSLIEQVRFASLFTFIFSPRKGTQAAQMDDPVTREEKVEWFNEMLALQEGIAAARSAEMVGCRLRVVAEEKNVKTGMLSGRSSDNIVVEFEGDEALVGQFVDVEIVRAKNWILSGKIPH